MSAKVFGLKCLKCRSLEPKLLTESGIELCEQCGSTEHSHGDRGMFALISTLLLLSLFVLLISNHGKV